MRSQLFGFLVPTQIFSEAELICSLPQADQLTKQLLKQADGICFQPVNPSQNAGRCTMNPGSCLNSL
jgi:hypothetical protein